MYFTELPENPPWAGINIMKGQQAAHKTDKKKHKLDGQVIKKTKQFFE